MTTIKAYNVPKKQDSSSLWNFYGIIKSSDHQNSQTCFDELNDIEFVYQIKTFI